MMMTVMMVMTMMMIVDDDDDDGDGDGDIGNGSHHYLMVVWALSAGDCLKFPSFPSSLTVGRVRM